MHGLLPYNSNSTMYGYGNSFGLNGGFPGQFGTGLTGNSAVGSLQIIEMMMTLTAAMLMMMVGQQSAAMSQGTPNFGGGAAAGVPGLGNFLGSGNGGGRSSGSTSGSGSNSETRGANRSTAKPGPATGNLVDLGGGHKVDASIAGNVRSMIQAAKKDGVDLKISSAHRSRAQQEALYAKYKAGTGNLAAKPGTSNHESGLAIDFSNTPGAYDWLKKNAGRFGLKNLPSEPWHYSTNGR